MCRTNLRGVVHPGKRTPKDGRSTPITGPGRRRTARVGHGPGVRIRFRNMADSFRACQPLDGSSPTLQATLGLRNGASRPESSGFTRAAARSNSTQSMVSAQIQRVGSNARHPRFVRSTQRATASYLAKPDKIAPKHYRCWHDADGSSHRIHRETQAPTQAIWSGLIGR